MRAMRSSPHVDHAHRGGQFTSTVASLVIRTSRCAVSMLLRSGHAAAQWARRSEAPLVAHRPVEEIADVHRYLL
jgi:hypothetical protein